MIKCFGKFRLFGHYHSRILNLFWVDLVGEEKSRVVAIVVISVIVTWLSDEVFVLVLRDFIDSVEADDECRHGGCQNRNH